MTLWHCAQRCTGCVFESCHTLRSASLAYLQTVCLAGSNDTSTSNSLKVVISWSSIDEWGMGSKRPQKWISFWSVASLIKASAKASASPNAKSPEVICAISLFLSCPSRLSLVAVNDEDSPSSRLLILSITICWSAITATDELCVMAIIRLPDLDCLRVCSASSLV